jgi:hypothetical protein
MYLTKEQFESLRHEVSNAKGKKFMRICGSYTFALEKFVNDVFDGSPHDWLVRQGIEPIEKHYHKYCVRWLDHVKDEICK